MSETDLIDMMANLNYASYVSLVLFCGKKFPKVDLLLQWISQQSVDGFSSLVYQTKDKRHAIQPAKF